MTTSVTGPRKVDWYALSPDAAAERLGANVQKGLDSGEAARRLTEHGPNRLADKKAESKFHAFFRQYQDFMQIILVGAGVVSLIATGELGTTLVLFALTVLNAVMGLHGEAKAAESLAALATTLSNNARVRRDGVATIIDADDIVPGDIVLYEAGDRVPADGRLVTAATLEIEESALTGESTPTLKDTATIDRRKCGAW